MKLQTFIGLASLSALLTLTGCPDDGGDEGSQNESSTAANTSSGSSGSSDGSGGSGGSADETADTSGGEDPPFGGEEDVDRANMLWTQIAGYSGWGQPEGSEGVVPSMMPHGAFAGIYYNEVAAGDPAGLPAGSIIVKDNIGDDMMTVEAVTVMEKVEGYEPSAGDWFWAKYLPDGTLDMNPDGVPLAGRVGLGGPMGCIPCHSMAAGDDYVHVN